MYSEILSDPQRDGENFIYLVHGLFDIDKNSQKYLEEKVALMQDQSRYYSCSLVSRLDEDSAGEKLRGRQMIHRTATMGNIGFILQIPSDDVISAAGVCSYGDLGTPTEKDELARCAQEHQGEIMSPLEMLTIKKDHQRYIHNELVLRGSPETKIVGIYVAQSLANYLAGDTSLPKQATEVRDVICKKIGRDMLVVLLPYQDQTIEIPSVPRTFLQEVYTRLKGLLGPKTLTP
ncbi:MAG: hypothetical protein Q8R37_02185 [Nanoarchaeota archaeon]|nr:hypothetical protein [Nanoarchaeota archaeon]